MNYGQIKSKVLKLLDEIGTSGSFKTTGDVLAKIPEFTYDAMMDLAATTAKIAAVQYITHNPVCNELAKDTSSVKKHYPGIDFSVELAGAQAAYFECSGPATVYIEEFSNGGWITLEQIDIAVTAQTMQEFKRLITASSSTNNIRLRFAGDNLYDFRNYILYPYAFPSQDAVQVHKPYFEYAFNADFLKFDKVMIKRDSRQYVPLTDYILRPDKKIAVNRYLAPAELLIHYWRKPTELTITGNTTTDEAQELDIAEDAALIIPFYVAGMIANSEDNTTKGLVMLNQYEAKKVNLVGNDSGYSGAISSVYGW